jgi:lipopolysaccharide transport system ATP-binding protein
VNSATIDQVIHSPSARSAAAPLLEARALSKKYLIYRSPGHRLAYALFGPLVGNPAEFAALDNVSFDLMPGDALAVVGRNGAGKSTLLQILSGVLEPTAGSTKTPPRIAGLLELGSGFNPEFTGRENIFINAAILGLDRRQTTDRLDEIIAFADIGDYIDQPVKTYSTGMFLRLAFSVAINVEPDLLLVDEALTVGDIFFQQKCYERLRELRSRGMGVLLVTHSMADAAEFCNRGLVLSQGRAVFTGTGRAAVEYFFHHERETPTGQSATRVAAVVVSSGDDDAREIARMNVPEAIDLAGAKQFGDARFRALRLLITDEHDHPRRVFEQGDWIRIYADYSVGHDVAIPLAGVRLVNAKAVLVHSRNSLQFDVDPPAVVPGGSIVRCMQDIKLDVDIGQYTLDIGFAEIDESLFARRHRHSAAEISPHIRLHCNVPEVAAISVVHRAEGFPCAFSHYGVANLPSHQRLTILAPRAGPDLSATS